MNSLFTFYIYFDYIFIMRTLIIIPVLLFSLLLGVPSYSADFNKGVIAAQNGDWATALKEWKPIAEEGNAAAQFNLGLMYQNGYGVPQDYKESVYWYRLAAEQGDADSQYNLGVMYERGYGVSKDDKEAVNWYRLSAEQGLTDAQYNLGFMYNNGKGVPTDKVYAYMWFNIAAANGDKDAEEKRNKLNKTLSQSQIEEAQRLSRECVKKNYKGC